MTDTAQVFTQDIQKFIASEDNEYELSLIKASGNTLELAIVDDMHFVLTIVSSSTAKKAQFTVATEEETLAGSWLKEVSAYLKQGEKSIQDVLVKATAACASLANEDDDNDNDAETNDDIALDNDDDLISPVPAKKSGDTDHFSSFDPEYDKVKQKFKKDLGNTATSEAVNRLLKEYMHILKSNSKKFGISAEPQSDNLFTWEVRLFGFERDSTDENESALAKDFEALAKTNYCQGQDYTLMEMTFPPNFPYKPPFIRVIQPRFMFHTGHVTIGGSICMELLTSSGWNPSNTIEAILIQIRTQLILGKGRIDFGKPSAYTLQEAQEAFNRVAVQHNWEKADR